MKLILHIGTEKTGTTTIQEFLNILLKFSCYVCDDICYVCDDLYLNIVKLFLLYGVWCLVFNNPRGVSIKIGISKITMQATPSSN